MRKVIIALVVAILAASCSLGLSIENPSVDNLYVDSQSFGVTDNGVSGDTDSISAIVSELTSTLWECQAGLNNRRGRGFRFRA